MISFSYFHNDYTQLISVNPLNDNYVDNIYIWFYDTTSIYYIVLSQTSGGFIN